MRILVACEFSGVVRDAFTAGGHDAMSCDLVPSDSPGNHYEGDVFDVLDEPWDMVIAFPPCTHICASGAPYFAAKRADGRQQQGIDFFLAFTRLARVPRVCIENPVGIMSTCYRKPDQIIQPWQFGDEARKRTCLWLKGLPCLAPTNIVGKGDFYLSPKGKRMPTWYYKARGPNGKRLSYSSTEMKKIRSRTFKGIAEAMAEQWGGQYE